MTHLYLLRHGKSDWNAAFGTDHERPINARGRRTAAEVGRLLEQRRWIPDLVACSTALRTRQTLERVQETGDWSQTTIRFEDTIYLAAASTVRRVVNTWADQVGAILVVGHQPTMSSLILDLTGQSVDVPTATLVRIGTPTGRADTGACHLMDVIRQSSG